MRIGVKEAVFEKLLEVRLDQQTIDFRGRDALPLLSFEIGDLRAVDELHRQHLSSSSRSSRSVGTWMFVQFLKFSRKRSAL